jgi:hypothetical protein
MHPRQTHKILPLQVSKDLFLPGQGTKHYTNILLYLLQKIFFPLEISELWEIHP